MNSLRQKFNLFLVLLGAAAFFSCKNLSSIGFDLQDEDRLLDLKYMELDVNLFQLKNDSVDTKGFPTNGKRMLLGNYTDPYTGKISADFFTQFWPVGAQNILDDTRSTYDSVSLELQYDLLHGSDAGLFDVEVYEMTQAIDTASSKAYYSTDMLAYGNKLGNKKHSFVKDSLRRVRVPLNKEYGASIFEKRLKTEMDSAPNFLGFKKGLYIKAGFDQNKALLRVTPATALVLHFHIDTVAHTYRFNVNNRFTHIKNDPSGTVMENMKIDEKRPSSEFGNLAIVQGALGYSVKMEPDLAPLKALLPNIILNRVMLSFSPTNNSVNTGFLPPSSLLFHYSDNKNQHLKDEKGIPIIMTDENDLSEAGRQLNYNGNGRTYPDFKMTMDLQYLLETPESFILKNGIILEPISRTENMGRLAVADGNAANGEKRIKLKVYYTTYVK